MKPRCCQGRARADVSRVEPAALAAYRKIAMSASPRIRLAALMCVWLAACTSADDDAPRATTNDVAVAVADAAEAAAVAHPYCDAATFAEVGAVMGAQIGKVDVIAGEGMYSVDCVYLDPANIYDGLSIQVVTTELLQKADSPWSTAVAYAEEWGRGGRAVDGLGDGAMWVDLPASLLVRRGEYVLRLSADRADLADAAVRARFETLARQVLARLP